jgi:hypothetical protein
MPKLANHSRLIRRRSRRQRAQLQSNTTRCPTRLASTGQLMAQGSSLVLPRLAGVLLIHRLVADDRLAVMLAKSLVILDIAVPGDWKRAEGDPTSFTRLKQLLPVPYCHMVFTVPKALAHLGLQNQRRFYALLFRAVAETLLTIAADPRRLGARLGFLAVLHTWSQNLLHHPHLHCLVPAGGLALDGSRWIPSRPKYFLPAQVLSCLFRKKLLAFLKAAFAEGRLQFSGPLTALSDPATFHAWLHQLGEQKWVVYAKPPLDGPQQVLQYLARYTHRVAISNGRLLSLAEDRVHFRWRDSKHGKRLKIMSLEAVEFIRRFLLHVLPLGFVKIRHFGFLANRNRTQALALCRQHLPSGTHHLCLSELLTPEQRQEMEHRFPYCRQGTLHLVAQLSAKELTIYMHPTTAAGSLDSS